MLGVTQQTYARLEANPSKASFERLYKVLNILGVEISLSSAPLSTYTKPANFIAQTTRSIFSSQVHAEDPVAVSNYLKHRGIRQRFYIAIARSTTR